MLIIGSKAIEWWYPDLGSKNPIDTDIIGTYEEMEKFISMHRDDLIESYPMTGNKYFIRIKGLGIIEFEIAWDDSTGFELLNLVNDYWNDLVVDALKNENGLVTIYPHIDVLYALKMSHRYLKNSPHFLKTMRNIQAMRTVHEVYPNNDSSIPNINPILLNWFKRREKETYSYLHPKLNQDKKNFFDTPGVEYKYDHDSIHEAVALGDRPAYLSYKPDNNEVFCDKDMFFNDITSHQRLYGVAEEAMVLALERSLIPYDFKPDPVKMFKFALMKVCTSITSGWFREFAWEHYDDVVEMYADNKYVHRFNRGLENGVVKLHK